MAMRLRGFPVFPRSLGETRMGSTDGLFLRDQSGRKSDSSEVQPMLRRKSLQRLLSSVEARELSFRRRRISSHIVGALRSPHVKAARRVCSIRSTVLVWQATGSAERGLKMRISPESRSQGACLVERLRGRANRCIERVFTPLRFTPSCRALEVGLFRGAPVACARCARAAQLCGNHA